MKLIWVRHGETLWNEQFRLQGLSDVKLNEKGHWQARRLADVLSKQQFSQIFVSPLCRAREFAAPLAAGIGIQPQVCDDLREISFGRWEGLRYAEMDAATQKLYLSWCNNPAAFTPPAGEAIQDVRARVANFMLKITKTLGAEETAVIITHGGIIRVAVTLALQMPITAAGKLLIDNASLTTMYFYASSWYLNKLNDTAHLAE